MSGPFTDREFVAEADRVRVERDEARSAIRDMHRRWPKHADGAMVTQESYDKLRSGYDRTLNEAWNNIQDLKALRESDSYRISNLEAHVEIEVKTRKDWGAEMNRLRADLREAEDALLESQQERDALQERLDAYEPHYRPKKFV